MKKLLIMLALIAVLCVALVLFLIAPTIPCSWEVTYQQTGAEIKEGTTTRPLFASDLIFIELPKSLRDSTQQKQNRISLTTFMVRLDSKKVLSPVAYEREFLGIGYVHRDQLKGVDITGAKVDDDWTVSFQDDLIIFGNPRITVILKNKAYQGGVINSESLRSST